MKTESQLGKDLEYGIGMARMMSITHHSVHGCTSGDGCPVGEVISETIRKLIALREQESNPVLRFPGFPPVRGASPAITAVEEEKEGT